MNSIWIGFLICLKQADATVVDLWKFAILFWSIILLKCSILSPTLYNSILSSTSSISKKLCSCIKSLSTGFKHDETFLSSSSNSLVSFGSWLSKSDE